VLSLQDKQRIDLCLGTGLLAVGRPLGRLAGVLLRRDHSAAPKGDIAVLKMLGAGSLAIAMPALLGIRKAHPRLRMTLVTTPAIRPFAEVMDIFDRMLAIDDAAPGRLFSSSCKALFSCRKTDTVVDLEVFSRMTMVFAMMTLARNRIGAGAESGPWRRHASTHLVGAGRSAEVYLFYDRIARLLGAPPASPEACREHLLARLPLERRRPAGRRIAIGPGCSELCEERRLSPSQWSMVLKERSGAPAEIHLLGSRRDRPLAEAIVTACPPRPNLRWFNHCGALSVTGSLGLLAGMDEYWGVDSALLHFARLLRVPCLSFWGPSEPRVFLRPIAGLREETRYRKLPCSPCVHTSGSPPCSGRNLCMQGLFEDIGTPGKLI